MSKLRLEYIKGDLHLPELNLWLDPHEPKVGPDKVFVSHAHSDHTAAHREVILSAPTQRLMQARVPGVRQEHVLEWKQPQQVDGLPCTVTLLPAGHIFGSAMSLIEVDGQRLLYTGDFKLRRGRSAEPCEPAPADILVMETTYGRPHYRFPPTEDVMKGVVRFCREALDNDETAVLLGYSLGKSQELLCSLGEAGLPLMLHGTIHRLTQIYEHFGVCFPKYEKYDQDAARGKVLLCPPNVTNSAMLRKLAPTRTAILTGWAVDPNCRFRYQCDAAFPLSDHADFPDLIEFVKQVKPKQVYTLHGFAADFAQTLRNLGFPAQALSQDEQLVLDLAHSVPSRRKPKQRSQALPASEPQSVTAPSTEQLSHPFLAFAETCSAIAKTSSKLEKTRLLSQYFRTLKGPAVALAATWFSGRPFASSQNKVLQLGWAVLRDALCEVSDLDQHAFHQIYLKHSDSGETVAEILSSQSQTANLSLEAVNETFLKLHAARGPLAKTPILADALRAATPIEAKYLVKIITGDLRIGLKEGLVEDGIAAAYEASTGDVRQANLLLGDIGETAVFASEGRLTEASLVPFRPVKLMLASPEPTASDIWQRALDWRTATGTSEAATASTPQPKSPTVWLEDKYDGIRCQLHKVGARVDLFSRDLKVITATFPELVADARNLPGDLILDGEIVAMRGDAILPFAELQKRLGRKHADLFMREEIPIKFVTFDILWQNGTTLLHQPLAERRKLLESLSTLPDIVRLARITTASSIDEIEAAFTAARERDNEGLMVKAPGSAYLPGRRGLAWLKLKKAFATLDCAVVGAEYGHGKRSQVLSDYTFAVRDEGSGQLRTIGKAYSGLTDVEIAQLTEHFLSTAIQQHGRYFEVKPDTVLEIAFDKLQPSTRHSSGLAMRFPRIVRIRTDKTVKEIDTLTTARRTAGLPG